VAPAAGDEFSRERSLPVTVHPDDGDSEKGVDDQQDGIRDDRLNRHDE
jgi:hypothetical protein